MTIDDCHYSFQELAIDILPAHMKRMRDAIANPLPMEKFGCKGVGIARTLDHIKRENDFAGCYVLLDRNQPIYVGISRTVAQRLLQHIKGRTHNDASLAYRIASDHYPHSLKRAVIMKHHAFKEEFEKAKAYCKSLKVAFIEIQNDLELYLFEVYCAMELNTKWNTFRTH